MKTLCIAHGSNCVDGYAASWVVHRALGDDVEFVYASYGDPPPDVAGRDVLIVDFSYKRAVLEAMAALNKDGFTDIPFSLNRPISKEMDARARSVLVLDHHRSAAGDLIELTKITDDWSWSEWLTNGFMGSRLACLFDMDRSGAGITWDFFNPGVQRPWFIDLVEDRDLWRFTDNRSRPFHAGITSFPFAFDQWNLMYDRRDDYDVTNHWTITDGRAILRKHDLDVEAIVRTTRRTMIIGGQRVPGATARRGWRAMSDTRCAIRRW